MYSCFNKGCPKSIKSHTKMPEGSLGNAQQTSIKAQNRYCPYKSSLYSRGKMDSEPLLKFVGYFPDYFSALSCMPLHFFGQPFVETAVYHK